MGFCPVTCRGPNRPVKDVCLLHANLKISNIVFVVLVLPSLFPFSLPRLFLGILILPQQESVSDLGKQSFFPLLTSQAIQFKLHALTYLSICEILLRAEDNPPLISSKQALRSIHFFIFFLPKITHTPGLHLRIGPKINPLVVSPDRLLTLVIIFF